MTALYTPTTPTVRDGLAERRALLEEQWRQQVATIVDLSYDALTPAGDEDDDGSGASERLLTTQILVAARQKLAETEAALARLDDGTYGLCADCSNPICSERLEVLPAARRCVICQATGSRGGSGA